MRNHVTTRKLKFDRSVSKEWRGDLVDGSDEWLVVYYERPEYTADLGAPPAHALHFFATDQPLAVLVAFDALGTVIQYQCDACLPAHIDGRVIDWVDLDLDVMAGPDKVVRLRDFADFARNSGEMGYTAEAIAAAERGVNLAIGRLQAGHYPFDGSAEQLLGRLIAAQGPL